MKINSQKKLLFIGPLTKNHGQGIVTIKTLNILSENFKTTSINTDLSNYIKIKKIFAGLQSVAEIIIKVSNLIFIKAEIFVYFTPSRNFTSSFKDLILLLVLNLINLRKKNLKVIAHLHGSDLASLLSKNVYGKILKILYLNVITTMIINSKVHKKFALGDDYKNYKIIDNPVNFDKLTLKRIEKKNIKNFDELKICFVSIPSRAKGLYETIKLLETNLYLYNWQLKVIGWSEKDFKKIYENKNILDKKLFHKIKFLGRVSEKEKIEILLTSNIFALLSHTEAQPLSVIEAGIFKCVLILSNIEMLMEFKKYKTVMINGDNKLDINKLVKLIKNKSLLNETSKMFIEKYSLKEYEKNLVNLFK